MTRPDPFVTAFSNFTPRPGAKVNITPDSETTSLDGEKQDEWTQTPRSDQCPTYRVVNDCYQDYWATDFFGRVYQLTDEHREAVTTSDSWSPRFILRALSFERYR